MQTYPLIVYFFDRSDVCVCVCGFSEHDLCRHSGITGHWGRMVTMLPLPTHYSKSVTFFRHQFRVRDQNNNWTNKSCSDRSLSMPGVPAIFLLVCSQFLIFFLCYNGELITTLDKQNFIAKPTATPPAACHSSKTLFQLRSLCKQPQPPILPEKSNPT